MGGGERSLKLRQLIGLQLPSELAQGCESVCTAESCRAHNAAGVQEDCSVPPYTLHLPTATPPSKLQGASTMLAYSCNQRNVTAVHMLTHVTAVRSKRILRPVYR